MQKALDLAKKIAKDLSADWREALEENNLHITFGGIYNIPDLETEDKNRIICFIIYAYSPHSLWLDLKRDRIENKMRILESLGANIKKDIFQQTISNSHDIVQMSVFNFLEEIKDWRWPTIFNLLEFSSKMQRFATEETAEEKKYQKQDKDGETYDVKEEIDIKVIANVNKEKGNLLDQAIAKRREADKLLEEIRKEFVATDTATQSDFGFTFTDTSRKRDIMSWRQYIRERNEKRERLANNSIS